MPVGWGSPENVGSRGPRFWGEDHGESEGFELVLGALGCSGPEVGVELSWGKIAVGLVASEHVVQGDEQAVADGNGCLLGSDADHEAAVLQGRIAALLPGRCSSRFG